MKNKKRIELNKLSEESPTPSVIRERNGVINPAFLPSTPESADTSPAHHNNHYNYNQQNHSRNNVYHHSHNPNWSNHVNQNGVDSQTSSWVYNFNESYIPESATLPIHSRFKEYGDNRYTKDNHLVYDVDLNDEHQQSSKKSLIKRKCCKTFLHLFVWCVIAVSLMGIAISVAFILYIEKFAKCVADRSATNVNVPNTITLLANSSSTNTTSSVGISEGQNATDLTTKLDVNFTATLSPQFITVSTLSPFNFTVNQTSDSSVALLSKSVVMEVNNQTTPASNKSLINDTSDYIVDKEESKMNHKFMNVNTSVGNANDSSNANIKITNESKIAGDFNISISSNDSSTLINNTVAEYYNDRTSSTKAYNESSSIVTPQSITRPITELVTNDSYNNNNDNTTLDRLNATTIDIMDTSVATSSPMLAIMSDTSSVANNTDWSYTTVIAAINHTVVADVAFHASTDFENVFKSSTNAINHETVNFTDLSLMISNQTDARRVLTL